MLRLFLFPQLPTTDGTGCASADAWSGVTVGEFMAGTRFPLTVIDMSSCRPAHSVAVVALVAALTACTLTTAHPVEPSPSKVSLEHSQWGLTAVRAEEAWSVSRGEGVTVAVLDTGVDGTHPDLHGRVIDGWSAPDGAALPAGASTDYQGHGTHISGIIAGDDDGDGITGIAPGAVIMPVRVTNPDGHGNQNQIAAGLDWAVAHGADVVNISMGGRRDPRETEVSPVCESIRKALLSDVVVVVSAGNGGAAGNLETFPAACDGALSVAAVDETLRRVATSIADASVGVAAPGANITSSVPVDGLNFPYMQWTGTSMAAPFVAGVAALVRAAHPEWDAARIVDTIRLSATDIAPAGTDPETGSGVVDAAAAVGLGPIAANLLISRISGVAVPVVVEVRRNTSGSTVWWQPPNGAQPSTYRVDVRSPDSVIRTFVTTPESVSAELPYVIGDADVLTVVAVDLQGERASFPQTLFDVYVPSLEPPLAPTLLGLIAEWTTNGMQVKVKTSGRRGPVPVELRTATGKVIGKATVQPDIASTISFKVAAAERASYVTVVAVGSAGQQFVRVAPQLPITAKVTVNGSRFTVSGSTDQLCSTKAKGCVGSPVKLVEARSGRTLATGKVAAGSTYRMTLPLGNRSWGPMQVYIGSASSPAVTVVRSRS